MAVSDASGQPIAGAFVKLKNDERRLTFMVISQGQGRFEAKDLPPGTYRVQGVGGGYQSAWFNNVARRRRWRRGGEMPFCAQRPPRPALAPAWPQRIPEADVLKVSKDPKDLPDGAGKELVAEKCNSCHDLLRVVVKRSNSGDWEHTVQRMRTRMLGSYVPDLSGGGNNAIVVYLGQVARRSAALRRQQPVPQVLMTGKALQYRVVTYALVNTHAEPHDVAMDPEGNAWVSERAGKIGRLDTKTLEFKEFDTPPGPAPKDRQSLGNPQIDSKGILWVADGPNNRWLSYDTKTGKFLAYAFPEERVPPAATAWRCIRTAPSGRPAATRRRGSCSRTRWNSSSTNLPTPSIIRCRAPTASRSPATARSGTPRTKPTRWSASIRHRQDRGVQDPVRRPRLSAPHEQRRQRRSLGGALERRQADEGRLQDQADDHLFAADADRRELLGGRRQEEQLHLGQRASGRQDRPLRSEDGGMGRVPLPEAESDPRRLDIDPTNPNRIFFSGNTPGRMGFVEVLPQ